jgi:hypothetical protein
MTGHRPFTELTKGFSAARKARVAAKAEALNMTLNELRRARGSATIANFDETKSRRDD